MEASDLQGRLEGLKDGVGGGARTRRQGQTMVQCRTRTWLLGGEGRLTATQDSGGESSAEQTVKTGLGALGETLGAVLSKKGGHRRH